MKQNVIIAFGGVSPEHEVSVLTAIQALSALEESEYNLIPLYITKSGRWLTGDYLTTLDHYQDMDRLKEEGIPCTFSHNEQGQPVLRELSGGWFSRPASYPIHAALPAFHGSDGENGGFQGMCEFYNIPFTGSSVLASSVSMHKIKAKELCRAHDLPVVDDIDFREPKWEQDKDSIIEEAKSMGYPLIVKPVSLGSSIGVQRAQNKDELIDAVEEAFRYDDHLMVEATVDPLMEINCSVLGDHDDARPSACERPKGKEELLSFEDKYQSDGGDGKGMASADRVIPADISDELTRQIQQLSLRIFALCEASGVARLDFLVNAETKKVYFNEINTIPGSFSYYLWEESDVSFRELLLEMIEIARQRHRRKNGRLRSYETNLLSEKAVKGLKGLKQDK